MIRLLNLSDQTAKQGIGQKAASLQWLSKHGLNIPRTFLLSYESYLAFLADRLQFQQGLEDELRTKLDTTVAYAIRSSANVEDSLAYSFAGQLTSVLAVQGLEQIVQAVIEVYESAQAPQLLPYLDKMALAADDIQVAVIIQEMIPPHVSGVVFSKNPVTGLDETIVEAVEGSGEALMQEGVTPERWVYKWGDWTQRPSQAQISDDLILQVIEQSKSIVDAYGDAVDLEWVYDGQQLYWLQLRPITTLDDLNIYSNRISREVLPGMIKPLVWSVNIPLVNGAWIDLFTELIGSNDITPQDLSAAFHYRAYFNMKTVGQIMAILGLPEETLELMMGLEGGSEKPTFRPGSGTIRHTPRMLRFAVDKFRYANRLEAFIPAIRSAYDDFEARPVPAGNEQSILNRIDELFTITQRAAYANIITPVLMYSYNALLRRRLAKRGIDFVQLDLSAGLERLQDYDPSYHLLRLNRRFLALDSDAQQQIRTSNYAEFQGLDGLESFQQDVSEFIESFGHLSDSGNDFSKRPWRETPDLLLQMIVDYGAGDNERSSSLRWNELSLSRLDRWELNILYHRARQFRFYREAVSFQYTYGYGLFRECFLSLGDSFANRGLIQEPEDIFYLYYDEVKSLVHEGQATPSQKDLVATRKQEMEATRDLLLPDIIYGNQAPPLGISSTDSERLVGIATSPGYYQGPVRVVRSMTEFEQVQPGDVLVIPYSDISWTPLFSRAGAVVAESGGILSHSSIVAREHGLPAVVSVTGACQLLSNGTEVLVDGYKGEVIVSQDGDRPL